MTKQWFSALAVLIMCDTSLQRYEHSTVLCVSPFRLTQHDRAPPRQRDSRAQQGARFGSITAQYDEWSDYIEPTAYSLQEQQRIVNWNTVRNLTFSGEGLTYVQCLRLFHTSDRSSWVILWFSYIVQIACSRRRTQVALCF
jgi:hypothetical protein